jgi:hypothetical protein
MMPDTSTPLASNPIASNQTTLERTSPLPTGQIRLIVVDLDGTTVGESNVIRPAVKQAVRAAQAQGIQVAVATGRMFRSALRFHQELESTLPLMAYQGAFIKEPTTEEVLRHWTVPRQAALQLLDYFEQPALRSLLSVHFYINDQLYVRQITPETQLYAQRSQIEPIAVGDLRTVLDLDATKILALSDDPEVINQILSSLREQYTPAELYFTKSVATFFEATNPLVNKGTAVQYLTEELLGLKPENVMAIGDNFNDLEMIQYAGVGVAMGSAPVEVQSSAQWVAPDVEADGVAAAIERFVLSG